jgi:hypothetical protein
MKYKFLTEINDNILTIYGLQKNADKVIYD